MTGPSQHNRMRNKGHFYMNARFSTLRRQALLRLAAVVVFSAASLTTGALAAAESAETREAVVSVKGMMCSMCARGLETRLSKLGDAKAAKVNLDKEQAIVSFPAETKVTDKDIEKTVTDAGFNVVKIEWRTTGAKGGSASSAKAEFQIEGMDCERCAANLARVLQQHAGVTSATVDFATKIARVTYEPGRTDRNAIAKTIESLGVFKATPINTGEVRR